MEDDSHGGNGPIGADGGSPESPYTKNGNNSSNNKEQDRFLPIANVGRIMKKVLPANGKISKDAKETVQECVSEFISFVTGEASDKCQREKRKTINGDDIIWAITTLGFEDYVTPLKLYLSKYRDLEGERVNVPKNQRVAVDQRLQHEQEQCMPSYNNNNNNNNNNHNNNNIFSSTSLMSHPPFIATDPISFSLPFSPNSIPKQLQPQEQIDSAGQW